MHGLIATLPSLYATALMLAGCAGAAYLWRKNEKPYAALTIAGSVSLGLLIVPSVKLRNAHYMRIRICGVVHQDHSSLNRHSAGSFGAAFLIRSVPNILEQHLQSV